MADVRLIDANALKSLLIEVLERIKENPKMTRDGMHIISGCHMLCEMIDDAPTIDAVEVVRCRECVFRGQHDLCPMNVRVYMLDEAAYLDCTEDDGFCHKGEKMDGGATDGSDN